MIPSPSEPQEIVCRGCGLLCDDLELISAGTSGPNQFRRACTVGATWLHRVISAVDAAEPVSPAPVEHERLVDVLRQARSPLVTGFRGLTLEAERAALELAEVINAYVGLNLSPEKLHNFQRYGGATCTLGEVRHRGDLLVSAGVDVFDVWPRFGERFWNLPGRFQPDPTARTAIYLGPPDQLQRPEAYAEHILVSPDEFPVAVDWLRTQTNFALANRTQGDGVQANRDNAVKLRKPPPLAAATLQAIQSLSEQLVNGAYPLLCTPSSSPLDREWSRLVQDLSSRARLHHFAVAAGPAGNSASETLLALTGFPDAVRFTPTGVEHDLLLYSAISLLARQQIDAVIVIAGELSAADQQMWTQLPNEIPLLVLTELGVVTPDLPPHALVTAAGPAGITTSGTMIRTDGVPLPLRSFRPATTPSLTTLIQSLTSQLKGQQ